MAKRKNDVEDPVEEEPTDVDNASDGVPEEDMMPQMPGVFLNFIENPNMSMGKEIHIQLMNSVEPFAVPTLLRRAAREMEERLLS